MPFDEGTASSESDIKFHRDSLGGRNEFFDDHQKWMIESFDRRY